MLEVRGWQKGWLAMIKRHVICVDKDVDLPKVGVNDMPFHLSDV
jgi:hypothetical protein